MTGFIVRRQMKTNSFYYVYHPQCRYGYSRMLTIGIEIDQRLLPNPVIVVCHSAYVLKEHEI